MKKNIFGFLFVIFFCGICISCVDSDDYKKYLAGGEIIYPQKADSVRILPGRERVQVEWLMVDPRVTSCDIYYEQGGIEKLFNLPIDLTSHDRDTIRVIIDDLEETSYRFKLITHDDYGNSSITVEAEGSAYGKNYESSLFNRVIRTKTVTPEGLLINWYESEQMEVGVDLEYTDSKGSIKKVFMPDSINQILLDDCDVATPFTYVTRYKPVKEAIDELYAAKEQGIVEFPSELTNAQAPFEITDQGWWNDRFGVAKGWNTNEAGRVNGNVDRNFNNAMTIWSWPDYSPVQGLYNAKIYQILSLNPGIYTFEATVGRLSASINKEYVVVSKGIEVNNIEDVERFALSYQEVVPGIPEGTVLQCEFELKETSIVSVGLVANIEPSQETQYNKFELKKD